MTNRIKPNTIPLDQIPKKIYYSISEASEFTGVEPHVLRYWETKFSKLNPKRVGGNQRKYTRNDIELLYEIVHLLYSEGFTLEGAERKLKAGLQALREEREIEKQRTKDLAAAHAKPADKEEAASEQIMDEPQPLARFNLTEIKKELEEILKILG